jgi:hypothetical protein
MCSPGSAGARLRDGGPRTRPHANPARSGVAAGHSFSRGSRPAVIPQSMTETETDTENEFGHPSRIAATGWPGAPEKRRARASPPESATSRMLSR